MKRIWSIGLLNSLLMTAALASPAQDQLVPVERRTPVPDFNLKAVDGKPIQLSSLRGKVVLLNFWATTCGGCKVELPWLIDLDAKYRNRGMTTVGVSLDSENPAAVKPFLSKNAILYPVVIANDELANRYGLKALPMTLLIDQRGKTALTHVGIIDRKAFDASIQKLLGTGK